MLEIEAVTVCINYADFLAAAIPYNLPLWWRWLIVTKSSDLETRELCRKYSLECLLVDEATTGTDFNKGWLLERGLRLLSASGWRLVLDADMVLPLRTIQLLKAARLQEDCLYGVDRLMVRNWQQWQQVLASGYLTTQHSYHCLVNFPNDLALGSRWVDINTGYVPLGDWQLWHSSQDSWRGMRSRPYPSQHNDACRSDIQHGLLFDRSKRVLLPELVAIHLESEASPNGTNWQGRKTPRFGPKLSRSGTVLPS